MYETESIAADPAGLARAAQLLRAASANADRLLLQNLTQKIANAAPSFSPEDASFVLAKSSTVGLEGLFNRRETVERQFRDDDGRLLWSQEEAVEVGQSHRNGFPFANGCGGYVRCESIQPSVERQSLKPVLAMRREESG